MEINERIQALEDKLEVLYQKELSRTFTESRLIEGISQMF